ncbi:enhanced intracellular survival protein Eis [Kitasatospora aureofaciens]|uniref:Spore coat protein n=1 Tax=Kitasatospora aureofaciens TaxID=1894 RepID=A0A1E7NEE9_KITAU|nr:GNAT family N-acetyltransferase [Kitasatospora aureofaciens]ARF83274.1 spore coat protein [Kitasatospora aureofaciens]OEV39042.1 spore coat protein [Kitasatospora aureofaciens]GGV03689.1 spore coat protein [Kitasatospora aureofaciens]
MDDDLTFQAADDGLVQEYDELAARAFGHTVGDITHLRGRADVRVALRAGRVVAGGLGLLTNQFFGGAAVPSACLAAGSVAPEERGSRLATSMVRERLRPLRERGAVISTISTVSNGYARHMGWEAPVPVFGWAVSADDLKRSFATGNLDIEHGLTKDALDLQQELARQWNGPVQRPDWWSTWTTAKNALTAYRFSRAGAPAAGWLSFTTKRSDRHGIDLVVHDFWASDPDCAASMLAFLGRHNSRAETVQFRRGALPPYPVLLHHLHRHRVTADAWHPWMLRVLDLQGAVRLRGWPADLDLEIPVEIGDERPGSSHRYLLRLCAGSADIVPTRTDGAVAFTRGQFAVWYAGGYRSLTAALMSGVYARCDESLTTLIRAANDREPWLPDHF